MMTYPDKLSYKTTVTETLRLDIMALGGPERHYLEIGCDVGYTVLSVAPAFASCFGVDIDPMRIDAACLHAFAAGTQNCTFMVGDSQHIPSNRWDVVLIDADHTYEAVKRDFERAIAALTPGETTIVFHDYGLSGAGVRKFVDELVAAGQCAHQVGKQDAWNPLGGSVNGPEAMAIRVHV